MKPWICMLVSLLFLFPTISAKAEETVPSVTAKAWVVMDTTTGTLLCEKNANLPLAMASTTKIMTTLLLLEQGNLSQPITVTKEMVQVEGTSMGLLPGDTVTREGLCYGMMLSSGNDAANTAAIVHSGSIENFAQAMNQKALSLGMKNTTFVTPSGLDEENHHSTAYDMALLTAYAMKNPTFAKIVGCSSAKISYGNPPYSRTLTNHNRLLNEYRGCVGVKTGFTKKAGRCLVSAATREGATLICVTLKAPNDWIDHKQLLTYGFSQMEQVTLPEGFCTLPVVGGTKNTLTLTYTPLTYSVPKGVVQKVSSRLAVAPFLYAPVANGQTYGEFQILFQGNPIASTPLIAKSQVELEPYTPTFFEKIWGFFRSFFS